MNLQDYTTQNLFDLYYSNAIEDYANLRKYQADQVFKKLKGVLRASILCSLFAFLSLA